MTRRGSPRLTGYAVLSAAGLLAALVTRRPELAVVAAPLALVLALGTRLARDPCVEVEFELAAERALEGEDVEAMLRVCSAARVDRLELLLELPPEVEVTDGEPAQAIRLPANAHRELLPTLRCSRWGLFDVGAVAIRARDRFRLVVWDDSKEPSHRLKAYPTPISVRRILVPVQTQAFTGSEVARVKGDGIEYADIRDFVPGDRVRSINWRATARRRTLVVNERHPERNTDVVLFVDAFADVRLEDTSVLEQAVRAGAALATRYLGRRDRVGLVTFGGVLRWLQPGMGATQRYRLVETLLETGVEPTYTWREVSVIPARILPPKALVIGLTPLVDPRFVRALEDLRARGFDVAVVEVDPVPLVAPGRGDVAELGYRLWVLDREVLRARLESLGIAVARWGDGPLEAALEEVRTYRRYAKRARV